MTMYKRGADYAMVKENERSHRFFHKAVTVSLNRLRY